MKKTNRPKKVGYLDQKIIILLELDVQPSDIFLGQSNIMHMQKEHPEDFSKYFSFLPQILISPDYVGKHPSKGSIEFIKQLDENVLVAVRASQSGKLFVRSIYVINKEKLARYIDSGTTVKVDTHD